MESCGEDVFKKVATMNQPADHKAGMLRQLNDIENNMAWDFIIRKSLYIST